MDNHANSKATNQPIEFQCTYSRFFPHFAKNFVCCIEYKIIVTDSLLAVSSACFQICFCRHLFFSLFNSLFLNIVCYEPCPFVLFCVANNVFPFCHAVCWDKVSQMIIEKVTTQNSGVRINWNMFWMQMENNWLFQMFSRCCRHYCCCHNRRRASIGVSLVKWWKCLCYLERSKVLPWTVVVSLFSKHMPIANNRYLKWMGKTTHWTK